MQPRMVLVVRLAVLAVGALALVGCAEESAVESSDADVTGSTSNAASPGSPQEFVVNVGDRVFFQTDSVELTAQATLTLDKQAVWLKQYNRYAFTIEGHADERGTREYNIALGARRAQAMRDYLVSRGVSGE